MFIWKFTSIGLFFFFFFIRNVMAFLFSHAKLLLKYRKKNIFKKLKNGLFAKKKMNGMDFRSKIMWNLIHTSHANPFIHAVYARSSQAKNILFFFRP